MDNPKNLAGYDAIRDKSVEIGLPKQYVTDIGIDALVLWEREDTAFIWIPRETGTYLVPLNELDAKKQASHLYAIDYYAHHEETARFFYWNRAELKEITGAHAYRRAALAFPIAADEIQQEKLDKEA